MRLRIGFVPVFPCLSLTPYRKRLETLDHTPATTPDGGGPPLLVKGLLVLAFLWGASLSSHAHCEDHPGQGPGKLAVGVRLASIQAANQAAREELNLDDWSSPGKGEVVSVIKIVRPGHPTQVWAGLVPILGVAPHAFEFVPLRNVYDNEQKNKLHIECEPLEAITITVKSIEDDGDAWPKIRDTTAITTTVVGLFRKVPLKLAERLSGIGVATSLLGFDGDEGLGEGELAFDALNPPPTDRLVTLTTTGGDDGASMLYQLAFTVKALGPSSDCPNHHVVPDTESATRCYSDTVYSAYSSWLIQLVAADSIDNRSGEARQFTSQELQRLRSDTRDHIWMVVDSFTLGLVESIVAFPSAHAQAVAALEQARTLRSSDRNAAIERYRESAMLAFGILSSDSRESCGGAGGAQGGEVGDSGGRRPLDLEMKR
ncbi:hypothetical protein ABI59_13650 [Acidobacteria bacterium Mor1]|nr:hypothetical protein ABI59_13650 [Acidobacteria bacterium Mor1]